MDPKYQALFTPWKIGNVEIKNRIVMCPMGGTSLFGWMEHTGNHFDKEAAKFFLEKANNNVGLIIPGIAPILSNRFAVDIVKAVKASCGDDYPVSLRYSVISKVKAFGVGAVPGEEYTELGRNMEESEKAAKYLQDAGYDMLNADNGTYISS